MEPAFLAVLDTQARKALLGRTVVRRYDRRQYLFQEGDPSDGMFLIDSGWATVRISTPLGDVATLAVVGPGEPLGEQSLVEKDARRSAAALAVSKLEARYLSRSAFDELRGASPEIDRFLVALFAERTRRLSARLVEALYVPAPERVLRRVAEVAAAFGADGRIPLTQEEIASLAGTTRPTVNRALREAEAKGAVVLSRGTVQVIDGSRLA
jgi:CRP/FNR family transcriptional regulator, cyclic AMP receptor protein